MNGIYKVKYYVEPNYNKPVPKDAKFTQLDGVKVSESDIGYADELFVASVMRDTKTGELGSVLIMSTEDDGVTREMLELVRDAITHYLEEHI